MRAILASDNDNTQSCAGSDNELTLERPHLDVTCPKMGKSISGSAEKSPKKVAKNTGIGRGHRLLSRVFAEDHEHCYILGYN